MFIILAAVYGIFFLVMSGFGFYDCITTHEENANWMIPVLILIMGLALLVGAVFVYVLFCNTNAGKTDRTIRISYEITYKGRTELLISTEDLISHLNVLAEGEEIIVQLIPEYFGLIAWKFIKKNNWYITFVNIHKKDKCVQYFLIPHKDIAELLKPFREVYEEHKAIDTSNLLSMKRYENLLEFYKIK